MNGPAPESQTDPGFHVRPAGRDDLFWISELQQSLYSISDAVPLRILQEWFEANPSGFYIIENRQKERLGQVTFLPLKTEILERYQSEGPEGLIEKELRGDSLFRQEEIGAISDLYLESLILPAAPQRSSARQALLSALPRIISRLRSPKKEGRLFALAATDAGANWLRKMGFKVISEAARRRDGHDMFEVALSSFLDRACQVSQSSEASSRMDESSIIRYLTETFPQLQIASADGNSFFYHGPKGIPEKTFPFATLVTKDEYDKVFHLDRPGIFRLNIGLARSTYNALLGPIPAAPGESGIVAGNYDFTALDKIMPHPVYGHMAWICVLNPGENTLEKVKELLFEAYEAAVKKLRKT